MFEHILMSEPQDAVVTLTLNRPQKKNALSIALRDEVSDALDAIECHGSEPFWFTRRGEDAEGE